VEIDVRHTSDGQYVLMHDHTVDRTTDGTGSVDQMTLAEIELLTVSDFMYMGAYPDLKVPTLAQALAVIAGRGGQVDIDMKSSEPEGAIEIIVAMGLEEICFVYSGSVDKLDRIRSVSLNVRIQPSSSSMAETVTIFEHFDPDPEHIELTRDGFDEDNITYIIDNGAVVFMDALGERDIFAALGFTWTWEKMMEKRVEIIQTDLPGKLENFRNSLCW